MYTNLNSTNSKKNPFSALQNNNDSAGDHSSEDELGHPPGGGFLQAQVSQANQQRDNSIKLAPTFAFQQFAANMQDPNQGPHARNMGMNQMNQMAPSINPSIMSVFETFSEVNTSNANSNNINSTNPTSMILPDHSDIITSQQQLQYHNHKDNISHHIDKHTPSSVSSLLQKISDQTPPKQTYPSMPQNTSPQNHYQASPPNQVSLSTQIVGKPPPCADDEHPLDSAYTFWFTQRGRGNKNKNSAGDFEQNMRCVASVSSVEEFWRVYSYLVQPHELNGRCDIHLFKWGIRPMWEDEMNKNGGKWIVRLKKGVATRCWENLVLAMLGEQFMVGEEVCGAVISVRYHTEDIVSVWNKTAGNTAVVNQIRDIMKRVLNLPPQTIMEYKPHTDSIRDASVRNENTGQFPQ